MTGLVHSIGLAQESLSPEVSELVLAGSLVFVLMTFLYSCYSCVSTCLYPGPGLSLRHSTIG